MAALMAAGCCERSAEPMMLTARRTNAGYVAAHSMAW